MSSGTARLTVGVIGLGAMGGAVARRLVAAGFDTVVFDRDEQRVAEAVRLGARRASGRIGQACDVLLTSLPADDDVRSVLLEDGVLADLAGRTLIELSTILPATIVAIDDAARPHGVRVIDCPVSGGPTEAASGQLVMLVGAHDGHAEPVLPVLEALGRVHSVGGVGDAKLAKLVNNMIVAGNLAVAAEAFSVGTSLGLDPRRLYDLLNQSGGQSRTFTKRLPYFLDGDLAARFPLSLAEKDTRLFLTVAESLGSVPPVAALVQQRFARAQDDGLGGQDMVAIFAAVDDWLRADG